jgi:thymidylate synthase (FAD)
MKVTLISYSASPLGDNSDLPRDIIDLVAFCARVSNPSNQNNTKSSKRLVEYLIRNKHWSPLEMVNVCLEIETTRDISRQLLRHRTFSFQEWSQRYADPVSELGFEIREARQQDTTDRQNSIDIQDKKLTEEWVKRQKDIIEQVKDSYRWAVSNGIAKECARVILPEGLTTTRLYVNGNLRTWIHYIELRSGNGTQKEHMLLARECAGVISSIYSGILDYCHT